VVLREALSNKDTPLATLFRTDKGGLINGGGPASRHVTTVDRPPYRMNRKLSRSEVQELVERYRSGKSTYNLALQFGTDRHTIGRHLRHAGMELRPQRKMTPQQIDEAVRLYADGRSLAAIGKKLGVSPTTIGTALKRVGMRLRDTHGRDRC
jgi:DNA-binding CsgD family transcriptional regulator